MEGLFLLKQQFLKQKQTEEPSPAIDILHFFSDDAAFIFRHRSTIKGDLELLQEDPLPPEAVENVAISIDMYLKRSFQEQISDLSWYVALVNDWTNVKVEWNKLQQGECRSSRRKKKRKLLQNIDLLIISVAVSDLFIQKICISILKQIITTCNDFSSVIFVEKVDIRTLLKPVQSAYNSLKNESLRDYKVCQASMQKLLDCAEKVNQHVQSSWESLNVIKIQSKIDEELKTLRDIDPFGARYGLIPPKYFQNYKNKRPDETLAEYCKRLNQLLRHIENARNHRWNDSDGLINYQTNLFEILRSKWERMTIAAEYEIGFDDIMARAKDIAKKVAYRELSQEQGITATKALISKASKLRTKTNDWLKLNHPIEEYW